MLILLAIPVILAVAFIHRLIQVVAPSNLLVRSVHAARPSGRVAAALLGLAAVLLLTMHIVAGAVSAGAPGWLNVLVFVLAWDALKIGWLAVSVLLRSTVGILRRPAGRASQVPQPTSKYRRLSDDLSLFGDDEPAGPPMPESTPAPIADWQVDLLRKALDARG